MLAVMALTVSAERERQKFNPDKYRRDQEAFIAKEACLTQQEAAAFFPLFREYNGKRMALYAQQHKYVRQKPRNDKEAAKVITDINYIEQQLVKLQSHYYDKFCKAIPAMKVLPCIRAEERWKRKVMERLSRPPHNQAKPANRPGKK